MLAYVFWHWRDRGVELEVYRQRVLAFQKVLNEQAIGELRTSLVVQVASLPWIDASTEIYEEWYMLDGPTALDVLNHAAVSGAREYPHNVLAQSVAGGIAALYQLHTGESLQTRTQNAVWFTKPAGMRYADFFAKVVPLVERSHGCLWQRYMTLGPSPEFCWQSEDAQTLAGEFAPLAVALSQVVCYQHTRE